MHELSIAVALVTEVGKVVEREGAVKATGVTVRVGGLSGVDPEALEMAFPVACEGTPADGAALRIEYVPADMICRSCGSVTHPELAMAICESCGSTDVELSGGHELLLMNVELAYDPSNE